MPGAKQGERSLDISKGAPQVQRRCAAATIENAHAVVRQVHIGEAGVNLQQSLTKRSVQRIDWTVARRSFDEHAVCDFELHHRHRFCDLIAFGIVPALVDHAKAVGLEEPDTADESYAQDKRNKLDKLDK